eukprot:2124319-Prymnesium_polylepis.1
MGCVGLPGGEPRWRRARGAQSARRAAALTPTARRGTVRGFLARGLLNRAREACAARHARHKTRTAEEGRRWREHFGWTRVGRAPPDPAQRAPVE